jgi:cytochrome c-type biogenesis protein CcmH
MYKRTDEIESWERWKLPLLVIALVIALLAGFVIGNVSSAAFAQADAPVASTDAQEVTPDEVNNVARQLWCPLCSGVRLDACELKACEQMKDVIAIKLAEGDDTESIQAYFVEQYGPQVMGEPPREGFNWLAWILPAVVLVLGGLVFWRATQRMVQPAVLLESGPELNADTRISANRTSAVAQPDADDEEAYTQKLEEELAKYG